MVDMNGIYCRDTCPVIGFECEKENGIRSFMESTQYLESTEGGMALRKRPGTDPDDW
jgi:hypothetical protein